MAEDRLWYWHWLCGVEKTAAGEKNQAAQVHAGS